MNALMEHALKLQRARNLNDSQFAQWLHVPRSVWRLAKEGKRPVAMTLLKAFARIPGNPFDPYILAFLRNGQPPLPGFSPSAKYPGADATRRVPPDYVPLRNQPAPTGRVQP